eukprot:g3906.t1
MATRPHLIHVQGDLLKSKADYIVHQANCCLTNGRAAGVAKLIFQKWEYANIYTPEYRDRKPGFTILMKPPEEKANVWPVVANLLGQNDVGRNLDYEPAEQREKWFLDGLKDFFGQLKDLHRLKATKGDEVQTAVPQDDEPSKSSGSGGIVLTKGPNGSNKRPSEAEGEGSASAVPAKVVLKPGPGASASSSKSNSEQLGQHDQLAASSPADERPVKIAFPFQIGCGLAGGDWDTYKKNLEKFAEQCHIQFGEHFQIYVYELPEKDKGKGKKSGKGMEKWKWNGNKW